VIGIMPPSLLNAIVLLGDGYGYFWLIICMFVSGLLVLILFQMLGVVVSAVFFPALPGAVVGLVLLFVYCLWRRGVGEKVSTTAMTLVSYISLMLIPSSVLIIKYYDLISDQMLRIAVVIILSQLISMLFCGKLMQYLIQRADRKKHHAH
jgi:holin-like protein